MKIIFISIFSLLISNTIFAQDDKKPEKKNSQTKDVSSIAGQEQADKNERLNLNRFALSAFLAKQSFPHGFDALDRDAQSPKLSWIPKLQFSESFFVEFDTGLTPVKRYPDEDLFYLINAHVLGSYEIGWNMGVTAVVGGQFWHEAGDFFVTYGGGLFYQFDKPLFGFLDKLSANYLIVPTPKTTTVYDLAAVFSF